MNHRTVLAMFVGAAITLVVLSEPIARGEVRRTTPPQSFSSGAMRSEQVLREIAATLRSIDARVARVEAAIGRLQATPGGARAHQ